jgi:hypothetical protein
MANEWLGGYQGRLPEKVEKADFEYWSRVPKWTLEVTVSLILEADPDSASNYFSGSYDRYNNRVFRAETPFSIAYKKLKFLIENNFGFYEPGKKIQASAIIEWLEQAKIPYPDDLKAAMARFGKPRFDWEAKGNALQSENDELRTRVSKLEKLAADHALDGPIDTKERESLLKLVIGMAVKGYGYDYKASKSKTPKEIESDLNLLGLNLSDDTIRKYLKEAAALLPDQEAT